MTLSRFVSTASCVVIAAHALGSAAQPPNDSCENATPLMDASASGMIIRGSTIDADPESLNLCGENLIRAPGVWYLYQSRADAGDRIVQVSTCTNETDSSFDTAASVFSGFCSNLQCVDGRDDDLECDAGETHHSTLSWRARAGQRYYVQIHGSEEGQAGNFGLVVTETDPVGGDGLGNSLSSGVSASPRVFVALASMLFSTWYIS